LEKEMEHNAFLVSSSLAQAKKLQSEEGKGKGKALLCRQGRFPLTAFALSKGTHSNELFTALEKALQEKNGKEIETLLASLSTKLKKDGNKIKGNGKEQKEQKETLSQLREQVELAAERIKENNSNAPVLRGLQTALPEWRQRTGAARSAGAAKGKGALLSSLVLCTNGEHAKALPFLQKFEEEAKALKTLSKTETNPLTKEKYNKFLSLYETAFPQYASFVRNDNGAPSPQQAEDVCRAVASGLDQLSPCPPPLGSVTDSLGELLLACTAQEKRKVAKKLTEEVAAAKNTIALEKEAGLSSAAALFSPFEELERIAASLSLATEKGDGNEADQLARKGLDVVDFVNDLMTPQDPEAKKRIKLLGLVAALKNGSATKRDYDALARAGMDLGRSIVALSDITVDRDNLSDRGRDALELNDLLKRLEKGEGINFDRLNELSIKASAMDKSKPAPAAAETFNAVLEAAADEISSAFAERATKGVPALEFAGERDLDAALRQLSVAAASGNRTQMLIATKTIHALVGSFCAEQDKNMSSAQNPRAKDRMNRSTQAMRNLTTQLKILSTVRVASGTTDSDEQLINVVRSLSRNFKEALISDEVLKLMKK
jgi:hypothetical protein